MRTKYLHITSRLNLALIFMMIAGVTLGQGTRQRGEGSSSGNRTSGRYESTGRSDRNERMVVRERTENNSRDNGYTFKPENNNSGNWKSEDHGNKTGHHKNWNNNHYYGWNNGYNNWNHNYSHHPVTYNVWHFPAPWKHARYSIVFRHDYGDYYFHHGSFYRYHPGRGYYIIDYPDGIVFSCLPYGYEEFMVNGRLFYRYGDVYLEYTPAGYVITRPPVGFYISAQF